MQVFCKSDSVLKRRIGTISRWTLLRYLLTKLIVAYLQFCNAIFQYKPRNLDNLWQERKSPAHGKRGRALNFLKYQAGLVGLILLQVM